MERTISFYKDTFEFIVKLVERISLKREHKSFIEQCELLQKQIQDLNKNEDILEFRNNLLNILDEFRFIVQAEIRFFLFPIPSIKQETYELGKKYMNNFLEWFKQDANISIEEIIKILNEELYLLEEAKKILDKMEINIE